MGCSPRSQAVTHGFLWCDNISFATAGVSHTHLGRSEGSATPACARGPSRLLCQNRGVGGGGREQREQEQASEGEAVSPGAVSWPPTPCPRPRPGPSTCFTPPIPPLGDVPGSPSSGHLPLTCSPSGPGGQLWQGVQGLGGGAWAAEPPNTLEGGARAWVSPSGQGGQALGQQSWSQTRASVGSCCAAGPRGSATACGVCSGGS